MERVCPLAEACRPFSPPATSDAAIEAKATVRSGRAVAQRSGEFPHRRRECCATGESVAPAHPLAFRGRASPPSAGSHARGSTVQARRLSPSCPRGRPRPCPGWPPRSPRSDRADSTRPIPSDRAASASDSVAEHSHAAYPCQVEITQCARPMPRARGGDHISPARPQGRSARPPLARHIAVAGGAARLAPAAPGQFAFRRVCSSRIRLHRASRTLLRCQFVPHGNGRQARIQRGTALH